jgi:hypothetical protein
MALVLSRKSIIFSPIKLNQTVIENFHLIYINDYNKLKKLIDKFLVCFVNKLKLC